MSKKLKLVAIIIFCISFVINNFYVINKHQNLSNKNTISVFAQNKNNLNENEDVTDEKSIDNKPVIWNLNSIFRSDDLWEKELNKFNKDIYELKNYTGKITKSKIHFSSALKIKEKLDIRLEKLYAYARLNKDINKNSYRYLDMINKVNKANSQYSQICSDLELEILKLSDSTYNKYLKNKKINSKYKSYLESIRKNKDHYLDEKSEEVLSKITNITSLPSNIYDLFNDMDKQNKNTPSDYSNKIKSTDRNIRKEAYIDEFMPYNDNINTLSGLLIGQVNKNVFYSDIRNYKSSLDMYLESDDVDSKIYNNLINTVSKNTESLHRYVTLRKKLLNINKVYYYDMFNPIVKEFNLDIPYNKAQSFAYTALKPLGEEYEDIIYDAFNKGWIDVYSNQNKISGGYCLSLYKNHPYILLNYDNSLKSVSTLVHELGHGIYSYLSQENQNYYNSKPSIFTHEVSSTTNEVMLYEFLIKNSSDKTQKAYYITQYLDFIKDTLYTQTMYAEFEKEIHEIVEKNGELNALILNDLWSSLLKKYYGNDFEVDSLAMVGWSRIPHFYNSFYVYKYATGCCSSISFYNDIINNGSQNYINFLKKGGSDKPLNLLKSSGIDLNNEKTIQISIDKFNSLLKELEKLMAN